MGLYFVSMKTDFAIRVRFIDIACGLMDFSVIAAER